MMHHGSVLVRLQLRSQASHDWVGGGGGGGGDLEGGGGGLGGLHIRGGQCQCLPHLRAKHASPSVRCVLSAWLQVRACN